MFDDLLYCNKMCWSKHKTIETFLLKWSGLIIVRNIILVYRLSNIKSVTRIFWEVQYHLDPLWYTCAVHTARHVHRIPPDVVLRLPGPDHPGNHGADVKTWERKQM